MDRRRFLLAAAAAPFGLDSAPRALAQSLGGTPLALVTADLESRIVAVELSSGRIFDHIPTLAGPRSIEAAAGTMAIVAHTAHGAVSLLDGPTLRVTHVLRDFSAPRYTAVRADGRHAYVTDSGRGDVAAIDLRRARVVHRTPLGGPARHLSIDASGRTLWVALGFRAPTVAVVDVSEPARPRLVHRIRPPFLAHDVGFTPSGRAVWVTSGDRGAIAVYAASSGRILRRLAADAPPQHVTFAGRRAYVASGEDGTLRVHGLADGRPLRTTRVPEGSYNVQQAEGLVLTPSLDTGTLCVVAPGGSLLHKVKVARSSHDSCFVMSR